MLACDEKCYRFTADGGLVSLITKLGFLAKNQKFQDSKPPIVIPALGSLEGGPQTRSCVQ